MNSRIDNDDKGGGGAMPPSHDNADNDYDENGHANNNDDDDDDDAGNDEYDDDDDDDSEYTYETVESNNDDNETKPGGSGSWLSRIFTRRRVKQHVENNHDDDDEEDDDDSYYDDDEEEHTDEEDGGRNSLLASSGDQNNDDEDEDYSATSRGNEVLNSVLTTSSSSIHTNHINEGKEEEAILMAEAIHRVRQRIQENGGNLYNILSEEDKALVDELEDTKRRRSSDDVAATTTATQEMTTKGMNNNHNVIEMEKRQDDEGEIRYNGKQEIIGGDSTTQQQQQQQHQQIDAIISDKDSQGQDYDGHHDGNTNEDTNMDEEENDDDDDEERPTLEEQRSLLTLAAEHDRVDVIQSLLGDSSRHDSVMGECAYDSLLAGISGRMHDNDSVATPTEEMSLVFVPPPLHVAVAHGSIHAASCLLRMGADPSIRPWVVDRGGGGGGGGGDRNYKKYHDMSAWELAFGGSSATIQMEDDSDVGNQVAEEEDIVAKEVKPAGRWFGFRSSPSKDEIAAAPIDDAPSSNMASNSTDRNIPTRRKRKQPLNIAPTKLDGIRHAFMSEALRAIGANEVHRLEQLLNAGMDPKLEVMAGKTLLEWARDMDAVDCCNLLLLHTGEERLEVEAAKNIEKEDGLVGQHDNDAGGQVAMSPQQQVQYQSIQNEHLSGLSISDLQMLISENLNLIPQLTSCRDDLASECTMCQSLLRDISATGGRGALSSQSLLELVRTLKEERAQAEEALAAWDAAWEEREEELSFFWEEVLDDTLRGELGVVLDQVDLNGDVPTDDPSNRNHDTKTSEELVQHFVEVDNRVKSLRASIAKLAEESATAAAEIESRGMSGALSLTRTLREEVKEIDMKIHEASMGEAACRRKIEIIQQRIDSVDSQEPSDGYEAGPIRMKEGDDAISEDFQLRSIVQQHEASIESGGERETSPILVDQQQVDSPVDKEVTNAVSVGAEHRGQPTLAVTDSLCTNQATVEEVMKVESRTMVITDSPVDNVDCNGEAIVTSKHNDTGKQDTNDRVTSGEGRTPSESQNTAINVQPSHAISQGVSTAIVVHTPAGQKYGSLSSQIWEILRMIVGLNRAPVMNRSYSHHSDENHPHIMVV